MDLYRQMDRAEIQFDFLVHSEGMNHVHRGASGEAGGGFAGLHINGVVNDLHFALPHRRPAKHILARRLPGTRYRRQSQVSGQSEEAGGLLSGDGFLRAAVFF